MRETVESLWHKDELPRDSRPYRVFRIVRNAMDSFIDANRHVTYTAERVEAAGF